MNSIAQVPAIDQQENIERMNARFRFGRIQSITVERNEYVVRFATVFQSALFQALKSGIQFHGTDYVIRFSSESVERWCAAHPAEVPEF